MQQRKPTSRRWPSSYSAIVNMELPKHFTVTNNNKPFLRVNDYLDEAEEAGCMVFFSNFGLEILRRNPVWLFDGTFGTCPAPYKQVNNYK